MNLMVTEWTHFLHICQFPTKPKLGIYFLISEQDHKACRPRLCTPLISHCAYRIPVGPRWNKVSSFTFPSHSPQTKAQKFCIYLILYLFVLFMICFELWVVQGLKWWNQPPALFQHFNFIGQGRSNDLLKVTNSFMTFQHSNAVHTHSLRMEE